MLWIAAAHSRQQHDPAYMTSLLFQENYSRRRCRQADFTADLLLLASKSTQTSMCSDTHRQTHTFTPRCQIDYRFSVNNPFMVPTAAATATRSRLCVCVILYQSEGFSTPEWRQETFLLPHSNKLVCSLQEPLDVSLVFRFNIKDTVFCIS